MTDTRQQSAKPVDEDRPSSMGAILAAAAAIGPAIFDPFGWDHFGPIRWLVIPAFGFWAIVFGIDRIAVRALPADLPADLADGGGGGGADLGGGGRPSRSVLTGLWAALLVWGVLASVLAVDRLQAWIGTPDRRFGWLTWLLCGGLFLVASTASSADRRLVARGFVVGTIATGVYTLAEWTGLAIDNGFDGNRLGGPFGQPAYLGAAAALAIPIAAGQAIDRASSRAWRAMGAVGTICGSFSLLASQSRAAWLATLLATTMWLAIPMMARSRSRRDSDSHPAASEPAVPPTAIPPAVVAVVVGVIAAVPTLRGRITSGFGEGGVVSGRIDEWQVGLRALRHSPVVGYGPEGYRAVFGRYVDQQYVIDWGREVITDRAHGGVLDVALTLGLPGALLYGALLVLVIAASIRAIAGGEARLAGLAVGVVAYAVQQQFFFPLSELDPLFWVAAGLVVGAGRRAPPRAAGAARSTGRSLMVGLATGVALVVTIAGLLDVVANLTLASALGRQQPRDALDATGTSISLRPDSTRYRFVASRLARQNGDLDAALRHIEDGLDLSPTDPAFRGEQAGLLLDLARATTVEPDRSEALALATERIEAVVTDDRNNPQHLQRLGIALALSGRFDVAIAVMERAITLAPDDPLVRQNLDEVLRLEAEFSGQVDDDPANSAES